MVLEAAVRRACCGPGWGHVTVEVRVLGPLGVAVGSSATLIVFAAEAMDWSRWPVHRPAAGHPGRVSPLRRTSGPPTCEPVRALAQVTEIGGYVEAGHSDRDSRLAVAVGRGVGVSEQQLLALQYTALIHDFGQLSLPSPIPAGRPCGCRRRTRADRGAAPRSSSRPGCWKRGRDRPPPERPVPGPGRCRGLPPPSEPIIRAVNAFNNLVRSFANPGRATAVVDRLRLGTRINTTPMWWRRWPGSSPASNTGPGARPPLCCSGGGDQSGDGREQLEGVAAEGQRTARATPWSSWDR